jgi:hypothetical protein
VYEARDERLERTDALKTMPTGAIFQEGWLLCGVEEFERGLDRMRRAVNEGYYVASVLEGRPQFDAIRAEVAFQFILAAAQEGRARAVTAFRDGGGERLLERR